MAKVNQRGHEKVPCGAGCPRVIWHSHMVSIYVSTLKALEPQKTQHGLEGQKGSSREDLFSKKGAWPRSTEVCVFLIFVK